MSDEPFFPPPQKKGAYREPAEKPVVAGANEEPRTHVVVTRPLEEDAPLTREEKAGELLDAARTERGFWERSSFWANYPRTTGAILAIVGAILSVPLLYGRGTGRASTLGLFLFVTGFWSLVAGYPVEVDGRFPRWWAYGLIASYAVGTVLLLALLFAR